MTRTLMELAEQDEELHLKLKAIYGELDADLAAVLSLALERGELAAGRDIPTLTAFCSSTSRGWSPSPSAAPIPPCWAAWSPS